MFCKNVWQIFHAATHLHQFPRVRFVAHVKLTRYRKHIRFAHPFLCLSTYVFVVSEILCSNCISFYFKIISWSFFCVCVLLVHLNCCRKALFYLLKRTNNFTYFMSAMFRRCLLRWWWWQADVFQFRRLVKLHSQWTTIINQHYA